MFEGVCEPTVAGVQAADPFALAAALATVSPDELYRDRKADQDQQHRHLDVIGVRDGEPAVRDGEEEVNRKDAGQGGGDAGASVTCRGGGHHPHNQNQRDRCGRDLIAPES